MQITGGRYFQPGESIPDSRKEAVGAENPNSGAVSLLYELLLHLLRP